MSRLHINGKGRSCWKIFYGVSIDQSNHGNRHCILIFKRQPSYVLEDFYYSSAYADVLLTILVSVLWFWKFFWNIRESQLCFIKENWIVGTIFRRNNLLVWTSLCKNIFKMLKLLKLEHFNFCLTVCQNYQNMSMFKTNLMFSWFFLQPFLLNKTYFNINL